MIIESAVTTQAIELDHSVAGRIAAALAERIISGVRVSQLDSGTVLEVTEMRAALEIRAAEADAA